MGKNNITQAKNQHFPLLKGRIYKKIKIAIPYSGKTSIIPRKQGRIYMYHFFANYRENHPLIDKNKAKNSIEKVHRIRYIF